MAISILLHLAAGLLLVQFGSAVLAPPVHRAAATLVFLPPPAPVDPKPVTPLPAPKLRAFRLPQSPAPQAVPVSRRPALIEAPVIAAASAPQVRPMPAIQTPEPPPQIRTGVLESKQVVVPQARATAAVQLGAFSRNEDVPNEAKLPVRTATSSAGFDAVAATQKMQNEPKAAASTGGFGGTVVARAGFNQRSAAVSHAGFGSAERAGSPVQAARQTVRAGFGDAVAARPQTTTSRPAAPQPSDVTPVEITFKPRPAYTDEARRAGVEGEILLEAVFSASGEVRVIRIVRGLPHGLNETALAAVHAIRFRPALRHGAPVDTTATVRMNFELAN